MYWEILICYRQEISYEFKMHTFTAEADPLPFSYCLNWSLYHLSKCTGISNFKYHHLLSRALLQSCCTTHYILLSTLEGTKVGYRKILSKVIPTWKVVVFTLRHTHEKLQASPIRNIIYTCIVVIHKWNVAKWIPTIRHQLLLHSLNSLL